MEPRLDLVDPGIFEDRPADPLGERFNELVFGLAGRLFNLLDQFYVVDGQRQVVRVGRRLQVQVKDQVEEQALWFSPFRLGRPDSGEKEMPFR